jgi:cytochrome c peroxidase
MADAARARMRDATTRLGRRPAGVAIAPAALFGALVFLALFGGSAAGRTDPHAPVQLPPTRMASLLQATTSAGASIPRAELVARGQQLFRSTALAKQGEACETCHSSGSANPALGTTEHPVSPGDFVGPRDPPALWGVGDTEPYFWTGSSPTLRETVVATIINHFRHGASQPDDVTADQAAAIVAYLETLRPPVTSFDQGTMSQAALRGEVLFRGKGGCVECHGGPLFTDNRLHDTFVPRAPGANDSGSASIPGAFNTPQLRDVANTAPYMHNGVFPSLRSVVEFYNTASSVAPLRLTDAEIDDLVAYLREL